MAIAFPTRISPIILGEPQMEREKYPEGFYVKTERDGDYMIVGIAQDGWFVHHYSNFDGRNHYQKRIYMVQRWWQSKTPRMRILDAQSKFQRKCEKLNRREMYITHDAEIITDREKL